MTARLMFDAVDVAALPHDAPMVGCYTDGAFSNEAAAHKQCPRARLVPIVVSPLHTGEVLDVEKGDATPTDAPGWAVRMRLLGRRPIVYASLDAWPLVLAAFAAQGVPEPFRWVADWTGVPHMVSGAVATQWADPALAPPQYPRGVDISEVSPNFPDPYKPKGPTPVTVKLPSKAVLLRDLMLASSIVGGIISLDNTAHFPMWARSLLGAASAILIRAEHALEPKSIAAATTPTP